MRGRCVTLQRTIGLAVLGGLVSPPLAAQVVPPNSPEAGPLVQDRARREAEQQAAERAARLAAPVAQVATPAAPVLGPCPAETPCFQIRTVAVDGTAGRSALSWVGPHLARYQERCVGAKGLDYILRDLQAEFLDRGLITTRAGLPEQELAVGTLTVQVIPGVVSDVRVAPDLSPRTWAAASPLDTGDLLSLRALEQGLEQMRSVPGRRVEVDIVPGEGVGESILQVTANQRSPVLLGASLNNYAGNAVGNLQGSAQLSALGVLGFSEIVTGSYNRRIDSPGIPADSRGTGASVSVPFGWWSAGVQASRNRYNQQVVGEVRSFQTSGRLDQITAYVERVLTRDQVSKTTLRLGASRRFGRNFIEGVEIGIQRQDLSDVSLALLDRRSVGRVRLNSELGFRLGTGLFGAQEEPDDRPAGLPTARYRIGTLDVAVAVPIAGAFLESYTAVFRGQLSGKPLYGSDSFSVGGPYTVRGYDTDRASIARSGYYLRQEVTARPLPWLQPFGLFDLGQVRLGKLQAGLGTGLRAQFANVQTEAYVAVPVARTRLTDDGKPQFRFAVNVTL